MGILDSKFCCIYGITRYCMMDRDWLLFLHGFFACGNTLTALLLSAMTVLPAQGLARVKASCDDAPISAIWASVPLLALC